MGKRVKAVERLSVAIHDCLANPRDLDPKLLWAAGVCLIGVDHPAVQGIAEWAPTLPTNVTVEDVPNLTLPLGLLAPGKYEVSVVYKGMQNVILTTTIDEKPEAIAEKAKELWAMGEQVDLGNEWEEAEKFTIRPVSDA